MAMKRLRDLSLGEYIKQCDKCSSTSLATARTTTLPSHWACRPDSLGGDEVDNNTAKPLHLPSLSETQLAVIDCNMERISLIAKEITGTKCRRVTFTREYVDTLEECIDIVTRAYGDLLVSHANELNGQHKRFKQHSSTPQQYRYTRCDETTAEEQRLDQLLHQRLCAELGKIRLQQMRDMETIQKCKLVIAGRAPRLCATAMTGATPYEALQQYQRHSDSRLDSVFHSLLLSQGNVPMAVQCMSLCASLHTMILANRALWIGLFVNSEIGYAVILHRMSSLPGLQQMPVATLQQLVILDWAASRERRALEAFADQHQLGVVYERTQDPLIRVFLMPRLARRMRFNGNQSLEERFNEQRWHVLSARKALISLACKSFVDLHDNIASLI